MGRLTYVVASLLLLSSAWANKKAFNIHDDILAYPQVRPLFAVHSLPSQWGRPANYVAVSDLPLRRLHPRV